MSESSAAGIGKLVWVTTPIGNLKDMTQRALAALEHGQYFVVEDSRVFRQLLNHYQLSWGQRQCWTWFGQQDQRTGHEQILEQVANVIKQGDSVYYLSDAGSPIISDAGHQFFQALKGSKLLEGVLTLDTLPGPVALIAALEVSGYYRTPFVFNGFLPRKESEIEQQGMALRGQDAVQVWYISGHRLERSIEVLCQLFPQAQFALVKELTKMFQQQYHFRGREWEEVKQRVDERGEFVLIMEPRAAMSNGTDEKQEIIHWWESHPSALQAHELAVELIQGAGRSKKQLSKLLALLSNNPVKEVYRVLTDDSSDS